MQTRFRDPRTRINLRTYHASKNVGTYLAFVRNVENNVTDPAAYENIIHPEAVFFEYPNLGTKNGQIRNSAEGMKGVETGKQILSEQHYEFVDFTEVGNKILAEGVWIGAMKVDADPLKGQQLKAYLCIVVEFKDG